MYTLGKDELFEITHWSVLGETCVCVCVSVQQHPLAGFLWAYAHTK